MTFALRPQEWFFAASALAMLGLAVWLLVLNVRSSANRTFAAFLLLFAFDNARLGVESSAAALGETALANDLASFSAPVRVLLFFVVAYFTAVYPRPRHLRVRIGIVVAGALALALLAWRPMLHRTFELAEDGRLDVVAVGPLFLVDLVGGLPIVSGVALMLARYGARERIASRAASAFLVSLGFGLLAVWWTIDRPLGLAYWLGLPTPGGTPVGPMDAWDAVFTFVIGPLHGIMLGALVFTMVRILRHGTDAGKRSMARRYLWGLLMPTITAVGLYVAFYLRQPAAAETIDSVFAGVWRLAMPLLITLALVRHQLFGIEVRVRWAVSRGTIAAIFTLVFLMATNIAANLFEAAGWGVVLGGVAAGLLLFGLTPIQRFADSLANAAVPSARAVNRLTSADRMAIYREQAELAWQDGVLSRDERILLNGLRDRLALSRDEAMRIEEEEAQVKTGAGRPRADRTRVGAGRTPP